MANSVPRQNSCWRVAINYSLKKLCCVEALLPQKITLYWYKWKKLIAAVQLKIMWRIRSSHRKCSVRTGVLRNFAKLTEKHLCQGLLQNASGRLLLKEWTVELVVNSGKHAIINCRIVNVENCLDLKIIKIWDAILQPQLFVQNLINYQFITLSKS